MTRRPASSHIDDLDRQQRAAYATHYTPTDFSRPHSGADEYFAKLAALRLALVRGVYTGGAVVDLGCASGDYLLAVAPFVERAIGVDFSADLLAVAARRAAAAGLGNVRCVLGNARRLPLVTAGVGTIFSFSSLYTMPAVDQVVRECARVLRARGVAILEFGVRPSLNGVVAQAHLHQAAEAYLEPLGVIQSMLRDAGLVVEQRRAFQLLPLWGDRPWWLRPLLHPTWKRLLSREIGGRMLDERLSSLWPLRRLAFRHLLICRRVG